MESKPNVPATAAAAPTLKRRRTAGVKDEVAESTFAKDLQVNCGVLLGPMCGAITLFGCLRTDGAQAMHPTHCLRDRGRLH